MGKKLISWNVNGLRACVSKGCFQEFMEKENPDVICLQETKLQEGQIEDSKIYSEALGSDHCPVGLILK